MPGRTLAIGDVHGCDQALAALLEEVAPQADDTVIFLGDLIDRGPESRQVVERVLGLESVCRVIVILGNHEEMLRHALSGHGLLDFWLANGGQATLASYGGSPEQIPPSHVRLYMTARHYHETDQAIFVHAGLEPEVSLANQTADYLRWKHLSGSERPHPSGKRIICGHTPQLDGRPFAFPGWVCIDTFAYGGKWLTCLDVESHKVWQASQSGERKRLAIAKEV